MHPAELTDRHIEQKDDLIYYFGVLKYIWGVCKEVSQVFGDSDKRRMWLPSPGVLVEICI